MHVGIPIPTLSFCAVNAPLLMKSFGSRLKGDDGECKLETGVVVVHAAPAFLAYAITRAP